MPRSQIRTGAMVRCPSQDSDTVTWSVFEVGREYPASVILTNIITDEMDVFDKTKISDDFVLVRAADADFEHEVVAR
jgi:hypothetical protein